jgi:DNA-binding HxlR family transcriptional regulator
MRVRILRELMSGDLRSHELQERLAEPTPGQLYHHLRELLAAGVITQPGRSIYRLPPRNVVPVLAMLACASDIHTSPAESDERS